LSFLDSVLNAYLLCHSLSLLSDDGGAESILEGAVADEHEA
jgi:hypothetical protein